MQASFNHSLWTSREASTRDLHHLLQQLQFMLDRYGPDLLKTMHFQ